MTLTTVLIYVGIAALILTAIVWYGFKKREDLLMSFVQNYCGAFFIFSGWVKAVDPLGTAYKMQQYFDQFESVFSETAVSFISPLFPLLSSYSVQFSVFMVVLEIVLGLMLIIGHKPKWTAWIFFTIVIFFTILTGFTFLTGYVPGDINFFEYSGWGEYDKNNMKVTDCGCFGDFIKLEPKVTFMKDLFLLIPSFYFLFKSDKMHSLFSRNARNIGLTVFTIGLIIYCLSNYIWDIPHKDFRDFKIGRDIADQKAIEQKSMADLQILAYKMTNKTTGEKKTLPYADYLESYKQYPSAEWDLEQLYSEPTVKETKISSFDIFDLEGAHLNDRILENDKPVLFIVAHKLYGDGSPSTRIERDTIYRRDTILQKDGSITLLHNIGSIEETTVSYTDYLWKDYYSERYTNIVIPFINKAKAAGVDVIFAAGGADEDQVRDLSKDLGMNVTLGIADDILLKTIVRSNPGIVLFNRGVLLDKWHYKKLPNFEEVQTKYLMQ